MPVLDALGTALKVLFDVLLSPFGSLPPIWGLLFISLLAGLGMILVFGRISDQDAITRMRNRMTGEVLGILLHVSRPSAVLRFAGRLIVSNFIYLWHLLRPLIVIALPLALVWGQLEGRYSTIDLPEERDLVTVTLSYSLLPQIEERTIVGCGVEILEPVMQVDTLREVSFRIAALPGYPRALSAGGVIFPVGRTGDWNGALVMRGFRIAKPVERLFKPWLSADCWIPDGPIACSFDLTGASYHVFGGHWSWLAVFLVFSSLSAIAGARLFRIKI
jgi:hypothetical protein